jgi:hypothetical protein
LISAIAAGSAPGIVYAVLSFRAPDGAVCAGFQALAAARAESLYKTHLGLSRQAFGIRAPLARQRTTLKKDNRSNSRPIVNGKTLNVNNNRHLHRHSAKGYLVNGGFAMSSRF